MSGFQQIRGYMKDWAGMTYQEGMDRNLEIKSDERWYRASYRYLRKLRLNTKMMDGYSFREIPKNNVFTRISFTAIFHSCIDDGFFSPATYFSRLVKACIDQPMPENVGLDNLCRGFLSFPSFIREYDLRTKIEDTIRKKGIKVESYAGPELDMGQHTDIIIVANGYPHHVWSYQSTNRGLLYAKKKLRGERGNIISGYHVLCPIDIYGSAVDYYGWRLYSNEAIEKAADLMLFNREPDTYQTFLESMENNVKVIYKFVKL